MIILVIDDELVSRKKLQKIMESFGECKAVDSARPAIFSSIFFFSLEILCIMLFTIHELPVRAERVVLRF